VDATGAILSGQTAWMLVAVFSVLWVALGYFWGRKTKSLDGHMLADRNVGLALGTATAVATWITSNTTMLAPQFALQMGIWGMLAYCTAATGLFLFAPMARRIRTLMPNGFTSGEFFRLRFGKEAWLLFLAISLFYAFTWLVSMAIAGGVLLQALSGIPYRAGMSVILLVCTLYTLFGGLKAVIGTDLIQSLIILIGIVAVAIATLGQADLGQVHTLLAQKRPALLDAFFPAALMAIFNNLLFGLGEVFHSNVWWSRAFAMRPGVGERAYKLAGVLWLPVPIVAGFIALAAPALDINIPQVNMVAPLVAAKLLGAGGAIMVFIVVFSSLASSIDSLLASTSDLITQDVVGGLIRPGASEELLKRASSWVTIGLSFAAWLVCLGENRDLATVLFRAGPLVGSAIWPVIHGLYRNTTNPTGVTSAMVAGSVAGLWAYYTLGWYTASLIGTVVSMLIVLSTSKLAPRPFDWALLDPQRAD
jgi:Na+/proline symporter